MDTSHAVNSSHPADPGNGSAAEAGKKRRPAPRSAGEAGESGWLGRITAGVIGGTLLAFAASVAVTIYVPGHDGLDQAFLGGMVLTLIWPLSILWILFAQSGLRAWARALIPFALFLTLDVMGLLS
ncbi:MAG: hypothetical protein AAF481_19035 [Acidobacteriota bacterium]